LDNKIFEECLKNYQANFTLGKNWSDLATEFGFESGEILRSKFKRARKSRGIPGKNSQQETQKNIIRVTASNPRVAIMDIETLPGVGYFFNTFNTNISIYQIIKDTCMLGWAAKFLNESEIYSDFMTPSEALSRDVSRIAQSCWNFLHNCQVIVGHNFSGFDAKYINTSFLECNLPPLKYNIVDTYVISKQNFRFDSNKLAFLNHRLNITEKLSNDGFPLWARCDKGDEQSLKDMEIYCRGDILSTEELFYCVRPYIRNFNVALYNEIEEEQCPVCGSLNLKEEGEYFTSAGKWQSIRCQDCGCISRKKQNLLSKEKKKSLLINS
jgi:hypothetical protein